jgi:hypothetical protein
VYGALLATVLAFACPAPAAAQPAPDCDTTGNSEILRTGKPIALSVNYFDADGDTVTLTRLLSDSAELKLKLTTKAKQRLRRHGR